MTPSTIESPSAVKASIPPSITPDAIVLKATPMSGMQAGPQRSRDREEKIASLGGFRPDDDGLAALPLQRDDRQLGGMVLVELHRPDDVSLVGLGERRVDLFRIGRARRRDPVEQDLGGGVGIGDVLAARKLRLAFEGFGEIGRAGIREGRVPITADQDSI